MSDMIAGLGNAPCVLKRVQISTFSICITVFTRQEINMDFAAMNIM